MQGIEVGSLGSGERVGQPRERDAVGILASVVDGWAF